MEINYFLDSQQIMFENLIGDVGLEGEIFKTCETENDTYEKSVEVETMTETETKTSPLDVGGNEENNEEGQEEISLTKENHEWNFPFSILPHKPFSLILNFKIHLKQWQNKSLQRDENFIELSSTYP